MEQVEQLRNGSTFADGTSTTKPESTSVYEPVPNSPFAVAGNTKQGFFLTLGQYRITEEYLSREEAIERLDIEPFNIVIRCIAASIDINNNLTETKTFKND